MHSDSNTAQIVKALRDAGCSVNYLDPHGRRDSAGIPDLLVGRNGVTYLLEVKRDAKSKRTPKQKTWHANWRGRSPIVVLIPEEALVAVGCRVKWSEPGCTHLEMHDGTCAP